VAGDPSAVPAQQGVGGDEPAGASGPGECLSNRAEQCPIVVVELGGTVALIDRRARLTDSVPVGFA
jgi:hypothetical protein